MAINLHSTVRGLIGAVNPDRAVTYRASNGYSVTTSGKQVPKYLPDVTVQAQIQPLSAGELQHPEMLNQQGVKRKAYLFGNLQGVVRIDAKGGDLLVFSQTLGGVPQVWLIVVPFETWTPDVPGWCSVGVVLQTDSGGLSGVSISRSVAA